MPKKTKNVDVNSVSTFANNVDSWFIMALKNLQRRNKSRNVHYIPQCLADIEKPFIMLEITVVRSTFIRVMLSVVALCGLHLLSHNMAEAYLQSGEPFPGKNNCGLNRKTCICSEIVNMIFSTLRNFFT